MKKVFLVLAVFIAACSFARAQEVGIRVGNVTAGSVAIDGVFGLSKFSRIHADVSFGNGLGVDALWDFLYKPLKIESESFHWYVGAGPYMQIDDPFWFGVAGEVGLEYHFSDIPLALGVDWRPRLSIVETTDLHFESFGFNVRYVFGK
jgi:hypothetical protein